MNGFVTIEAGVFTGSGFAMELKSAVTEVTKTAAAISGVPRLKNLLAEIFSVFRPYNVAMATTTAVMTATKGIVRLVHLLCVKQISSDVAAA